MGLLHLLIFFTFGSSAAHAAACKYYLNDRPVKQKLQVVDQRLSELSIGDLTNSQKMFGEILKPILTKSRRASVNIGSTAGFEEAGSSVGFFQEPESGNKKIIKVLKIEVSQLLSVTPKSAYELRTTWVNGPAFPFGVKSLASEVLMAIKGNLLAATQGGPEVFRVGTWQENGKTYLAIELERKFPDTKTINMKSFGAAEIAFAHLNDPAESEALAEKIAALFTGALEDNIIPLDAQFLMTAAGDLSWIDGDEWIQFDPARVDYDWNYFSSFVVMDFVTWFEKSPAFGKKILRKIVSEIRKFPAKKQTAILEGLRTRMDHPVWVDAETPNTPKVRTPFRKVLQTLGVSIDPATPDFLFNP